MKVVALISGGKDSCYNMCKCVSDGHEIVALANLYSESGEEVDSFMYQTVGCEAVPVYSEAMDLPLYRRVIQGRPVNLECEYSKEDGDEVEDMYELLLHIRKEGIHFDAISVGAIHSQYQTSRARDVCDRLGLTLLSYLWHRDQVQLLQEMIDYGIHAILIKVAVIGLDSQHLGLSLKQIQPTLLLLKDRFHINVCGEGGEFESLTLDCPLFKKKLILDDFQIVLHSNDAFAPVYYLKPTKISLGNK